MSSTTRSPSTFNRERCSAACTHTRTRTTCTRVPKPEVGRTIEVTYNPKDPGRAVHDIRDATADPWTGVLFSGLFGAVFVTVGVVRLLWVMDDWRRYPSARVPVSWIRA